MKKGDRIPESGEKMSQIIARRAKFVKSMA